MCPRAETLGVAGQWQPWKSPEGQWVNSFTMLTINADTHPIFRELHRPDPKRPPHMQDRRMVVVILNDAYGAWLDAPPEGSMEFLLQYLAGDKFEVIRRNFYRPTSEKALAKYSGQFPKLVLFKIADAFGGLAKADKAHFADGSSFDQIYTRK